jgi:hypothetical protein
LGAADTPCVSCRQLYPVVELDRYLWCPACQREVRRRGRRWGGLAGGLAALGVAAYIYLTIHPSRRFLAFYLVLVATTFALLGRIVLTVVRGYYRARGSVLRSDAAAEPGAGPEEH